MDLRLLWWIQLAPLVAFLLIQLLPTSLKKYAPLVGVGAAFSAAAASSVLFWMHRSSGLPLEFQQLWLVVSGHPLWLDAGADRYVLYVGFLLDKIGLLMIWLVTVITFFVQLFSFYYMAEDPSRPRYFGFLSFFAFSMTGLVLSNNLLQTFIFWELVGLTSYLLIGFWYEKPSAATAARKAFVINRLGDLGFYLGIILLFLFFGSLNFTDLTTEALREAFSPRSLTILGVLIFMGVMGKSAQFPFHNWLPDAMEGPTPVSALIHSATMVAAGVFLLVRAFDFFSASAGTLQVVLVIGALTALSAAALATFPRDIKKILAYSTISQLGLMVMAVGAGGEVAAMFHLTTHAFFKSLLFLTAGAFIHHFHSNDIWQIARAGGKNDKLPMMTLFIGLASLCAVPPFAGFFSKDLILEVLKEKNLFFFGVAVLVSLLTVYYSCRMLFVFLFSRPAAHHENHHPHATAHASPLIDNCRAIPLISLAVISVIMGFLGSPLSSFLLHWIGSEHGAHFDAALALTTLALLVVGGGWAYLRFRDAEAAEKKLEAGHGPWHTLVSRKFFVDDAYDFIVKKIGLGLAAILNWFDRTVINGLMVNQSSYSILRLGRLGARLQSGLLQDYLSLALLAGVVIIFWVIL